MRSVDAASKLPPSLHDLPTGIVNGSSAMEAGSHERKLVRDLSMKRQDFRNLHPRRCRRDRLERTAYLQWRIRLHVKRIDLTGRAQVKDHDGRAFAFARIDLTSFDSRQILRQSKTDRAQRSSLQKVAACNTVASLGSSLSSKSKHVGLVPPSSFFAGRNPSLRHLKQYNTTQTCAHSRFTKRF